MNKQQQLEQAAQNAINLLTLAKSNQGAAFKAHKTYQAIDHVISELSAALAAPEPDDTPNEHTELLREMVNHIKCNDITYRRSDWYRRAQDALKIN